MISENKKFIYFQYRFKKNFLLVANNNCQNKFKMVDNIIHMIEERKELNYELIGKKFRISK